MVESQIALLHKMPSVFQRANAVSEVEQNRPQAIRRYDQIYMRSGDFVRHLDILASFVEGQRVAFVGDGDAVALALCHLANLELLPAPLQCTVLDFDERMIHSITRFRQQHGLGLRIDAHLYNVVDPLPSGMCGQFDCFHTNPPYSSFNKGRTANVFIARGMELCGAGGTGYIVLPYEEGLFWTSDVLLNVERFLAECGWVVVQASQYLHTYHLDDNPSLRSGLLVVKRVEDKCMPYAGRQLRAEELTNFYNRANDPVPHYIRDVQGGFREDFSWDPCVLAPCAAESLGEMA